MGKLRRAKVSIGDRHSIKKGLGDIRNLIENLSVASQGQSIETALMSAAKPIADAVKSEVEVKSGKLKLGVTRVKMKPKRAGEVARVGVTVKNPRGVKFVSSRWHWEEFGFKRRKKALKPYFLPGYKKSRDKALSVFEKQLAANYAKALRGRQRLTKNWRVGGSGGQD